MTTPSSTGGEGGMGWSMAIPIIMTAISALYNSKGEKSSTYSKGQEKLIDQATEAALGRGAPPGIEQNKQYQQGGEWLNSLFNDPEFFRKFEAPLMRQYEEETIPGLTNRFAAMGSGGALGSTGFRNQLAREGERLHENIAAQRGNMQQQGVNQSLQYSQAPGQDYYQLLNSVLGPQPNNIYQPPNNPYANMAGAAWQGYLQQPNQYNNPQSTPVQPALQPGQNPSTA